MRCILLPLILLFTSCSHYRVEQKRAPSQSSIFEGCYRGVNRILNSQPILNWALIEKYLSDGKIKTIQKSDIAEKKLAYYLLRGKASDEAIEVLRNGKYQKKKYFEKLDPRKFKTRRSYEKLSEKVFAKILGDPFRIRNIFNRYKHRNEFRYQVLRHFALEEVFSRGLLKTYPELIEMNRMEKLGEFFRTKIGRGIITALFNVSLLTLKIPTYLPPKKLFEFLETELDDVLKHGFEPNFSKLHKNYRRKIDRHADYVFFRFTFIRVMEVALVYLIYQRESDRMDRVNKVKEDTGRNDSFNIFVEDFYSSIVKDDLSSNKMKLE